MIRSDEEFYCMWNIVNAAYYWLCCNALDSREMPELVRAIDYMDRRVDAYWMRDN